MYGYLKMIENTRIWHNNFIYRDKNIHMYRDDNLKKYMSISIMIYGNKVISKFIAMLCSLRREVTRFL